MKNNPPKSQPNHKPKPRTSSPPTTKKTKQKQPTKIIALPSHALAVGFHFMLSHPHEARQRGWWKKEEKRESRKEKKYEREILILIEVSNIYIYIYIFKIWATVDCQRWQSTIAKMLKKILSRATLMCATFWEDES